jgi:hypothetical protein
MPFVSLHAKFIYLSKNINVMIVVLILFLVLIIKNHFFLTLVNSRLEDLVRPRVLLPPIVLLILVLKVVIPYIRVSIRDTDIHSLVFQHP